MEKKLPEIQGENQECHRNQEVGGGGEINHLTEVLYHLIQETKINEDEKWKSKKQKFVPNGYILYTSKN